MAVEGRAGGQIADSASRALMDRKGRRPGISGSDNAHFDISAAAIRVANVRKSYGKFAAIKAASFTVGVGEVVALLGPSGCGKTTLLRCIAGLERIDEGTIEIDDVVVSTSTGIIPPERRNVGFVFQSYALWPHLSVAENVAYGLKAAKRSSTEIRSAVAEILELVGLAELSARMPGELSGGQQQRVALARSLVVRPRVLLLDEPLSNLDASLRDRMRQEIRGLLKKVGITAVFVTHDQREAFAISDRVVLMNAGTPVQIDTPEAMYAQPTSVFAATFLGGANVVAIANFQEIGDSYSTAWSRELGGLHGKRSGAGSVVPGFAMFRPENIHVVSGVAASGDHANSWEGTVIQRTFEGSSVELVVQSGSLTIRIVGRHYSVGIGDRIGMHVEPDDLLFLAE